ncbi:MAG: FAD-dependent oxidoreductase [Opitutales bacterium]
MEKTIDLELAILGGGFAGVYCGKSLAKIATRGNPRRIGLIADENHMVFQPMLPEVASASISPRHVVNPIRHLCRGLEIYKATIKSIDLKNKELTLRPGPFSPDFVIRFRHLVVALGAQVDVSRVPGMPEHAYLMQNVGDAMKLRATVISRFEEANLVSDPVRRRRLLTFVVVGGGYSGVETAGQILDLFQGINQYYSNIGPEDFQVHLIHSRDHLLPTLSKKLGKYAEAKLRRRGLNVILNKRVKALTANRVFLDDDTGIDSNTAVSTVGTKPHALVTQLAEDAGLETSRGRIVTRNTLQAPGYDWLWAAGDCAAVPLPDGGESPPTAQFAMRQGKLLGKNVAAFLQSKPMRPFSFEGLGELAAIGHRTAVAEVLGFKFSGFIAWWMWRTVYLAKLPGLDRKLRVVIDWTLDLFFPRDINLLNPRYTRTLQEAYLEKGDVLFQAGDPAFSFYIVRSGSIRITGTDGALIKTVGAGEFFGERAMLADKKWRFNATAAERTSLVGVGSEEFISIFGSSAILRQMLERSARQYRTTEEINRMKATFPQELLESRAASLMTQEVVRLGSNDGLQDTLSLLNRERHSFYPVIDEASGKLCGVLTRRAFYDHLQYAGFDDTTKAGELELSNLPKVRAETPVKECIDIMIRAGTNKLLVCADEEQLAGILSIRDLITRAFCQA